MQVLYPLYFRHHGVRRAVQLVAPKLSDEEMLSLPRDSILHYVAEDESLYGIPQDDPVVASIQRMIYVDHRVELTGDKGPPRPTRRPPSTMIRTYHRKYRKTRKLFNLDAALRDSRSLLVENYALLPHLYRYTKSYFSTYYRWWNIQATLWRRVVELTEITDREQFIVCKVPSVLPALPDLKRGEVSTSRAVLNRFKDHESLFILELWKWLGPQRQESLLGQLSRDVLDKVNLIWLEAGKWTVLNLGRLDRWRKPTETELADGAEKGGMLSPMAIQKRFLRLLMFLTEFRFTPDDEVTGVRVATKVEAADTKGKETESADKKASSEKPSTTKLDDFPNLGLGQGLKLEVSDGEAKGQVIDEPLTISVPDPVNSQKTIKLVLKPGLDIDNLPVDAIEETDENIKAIDEAISKDLEAMAELSSAPEDDPEHPEDLATEEPLTPTAAYTPKPRSLAQGVMSKADELADVGMLSGAEYRRFTALSEAYKKLPDPYGKAKSLEEQLTIAPESLKLDNAPQIPNLDAVTDKSMLKSRLFEFDSKYIEQVLPKDVSNAVMAIQNAGVAVTGYQVEHVDDALNSYDAHTVNIVPVRGKPSTIHFRLPTVNEDGTVRSNGVRYRVRKQRGDNPIRKLSPTKVALTSYYAKIFVTRSEKQVHNYAGWLTNQIAALGMDPANDTVTELMIADVFDSNTHVPRLYSIIAKRFRSFDIGKGKYFFDYKEREKFFGKDFVKQAERNGMVTVGYFSGKTKKEEDRDAIAMDEGGTLYRLSFGEKAKDTDVTVLGTFESLLDFNPRKAPLELIDVKVFGKHIPVGIFLAYHMGLDQLIATLKVEPRSVPSGERLNLADDEFALSFAEESLVFTRENTLAASVLSGFAQLNSTTSNYPKHLFEKKDIYFNLMDKLGLGVRYLREMDLMVDLFVDPITKEILESMNEPTDFLGLLLRASELLQTDWSPDETDLAYMRIKGYERMAGAVYGEIVKGVRLQRARGTANAPVDIKPNAIWNAVLRDPAVKLVEESNPVHNLKEMEEVTYTGTGGRTSRSMVGRTRVFHQNDMGVISEATKDSSDVALTTFLTADPNFKDVRGLTGRYTDGNLGPSSMLSTSALLAPASTNDDPKRVLISSFVE